METCCASRAGGYQYTALLGYYNDSYKRSRGPPFIYTVPVLGPNVTMNGNPTLNAVDADSVQLE